MYRLKPRREHVRHPDRSTVQYVHTILELTRIDYTVVSQSQTNRLTDWLTRDRAERGSAAWITEGVAADCVI